MKDVSIVTKADYVSPSLFRIPNYLNTVAAYSDYHAGIETPLCSETRELPNIAQYRARVLSVVREEGLNSVSDPQCFMLLAHAVEVNITNYVS